MKNLLFFIVTDYEILEDYNVKTANPEGRTRLLQIIMRNCADTVTFPDIDLIHYCKQMPKAMK